MKTSSQRTILYLLEFGPVSEKVLQYQIVLDRLEKILHTCAQQSGWEIDSCDVLPDYVAITLYLESSVDVEDVTMHLKQYSSDTLLQEFAELKPFVVEGSLWQPGYDIEILV